MNYKSIPFTARITGQNTSRNVASQLQAVIDKQTRSGWEFVKIETVETFVAANNGCFGLGGNPAFFTTYSLIIFQSETGIDIPYQETEIVEENRQMENASLSSAVTPQQNIDIEAILQPILVSLKKTITQLLTWGKANPQKIGIWAAVLIGLWGLYAIFIKNYPDKDAATLGKMYCDCHEKKKDAIVKSGEEFVQLFDQQKFTNRQEARENWATKENTALVPIQNSEKQIEEKYASYQKRYSNDYNAANVLTQNYNRTKSECEAKYAQYIQDTYKKIENIIATVQSPEPDVEKIKSDLLGKAITGWKFDYLSEFGNMEIINTTRNNQRIEHDLKLHLIGETNKGEHECELKVTYTLQDYGWQLNTCAMQSITYTYTAPVNSWQSIQPLSGCYYDIIDNGHQYWVLDGYGWFAPKYKGGPGGEKFTLTNSEINISSREPNPVEIQFKYKATK